MDLDRNNPFWSQSSDRRVIGSSKAGEEYDDGYGYHVTDDSSATAKYVPDIGVAGEYEIYEWHGWDGDDRGDEDEATNVIHRVVISNNETLKVEIDQSDETLYGQWNLIGTFNLPKGKDSWVEISANGANGPVIADAIMFRYLNNTVEPDDVVKVLKTDFNCDGKAGIRDLGIMLSKWMVEDLSVIEEYLHGSCSDPKTLNLNKIGSSENRIDIFDVNEMLYCWGVPGTDSCFK